MPKVKIVAVSHNYDYASDEELRSFVDALDWVEISDEDLLRVRNALVHRHKVKDDPFRTKSLMILEEVVPDRFDLWDLVAKCEEVGRKEEGAKRKRFERAEALKKGKAEATLRRKQAMLTKLQKELGVVDSKST